VTTAAVWSPDVRTAYAAFRVPGAKAPFDTVHLRIDYPVEDMGDGLSARATPLPVVIFGGDTDCPSQSYYWLTRRLAGGGSAVITWTWIAELAGHRIGISSGLDPKVLSAAVLSDHHPSPMLQALLDCLASTKVVPPDTLDLNRLVLGGHGAGGTWALLCSANAFTPHVVGAFSYGGDAEFPLTHDCPVLLINGSEDEPLLAPSSESGVVEILGANLSSITQDQHGPTDEFARLGISSAVEGFVREVLTQPVDLQ